MLCNMHNWAKKVTWLRAYGIMGPKRNPALNSQFISNSLIQLTVNRLISLQISDLVY